MYEENTDWICDVCRRSISGMTDPICCNCGVHGTEIKTVCPDCENVIKNNPGIEIGVLTQTIRKMFPRETTASLRGGSYPTNMHLDGERPNIGCDSSHSGSNTQTIGAHNKKILEQAYQLQKQEGLLMGLLLSCGVLMAAAFGLLLCVSDFLPALYDTLKPIVLWSETILLFAFFLIGALMKLCSFRAQRLTWTALADLQTQTTLEK